MPFKVGKDEAIDDVSQYHIRKIHQILTILKITLFFTPLPTPEKENFSHSLAHFTQHNFHILLPEIASKEWPEKI
jgi:hypothetical protein